MGAADFEVYEITKQHESTHEKTKGNTFQNCLLKIIPALQ